MERSDRHIVERDLAEIESALMEAVRAGKLPIEEARERIEAYRQVRVKAGELAVGSAQLNPQVDKPDLP